MSTPVAAVLAVIAVSLATSCRPSHSSEVSSSTGAGGVALPEDAEAGPPAVSRKIDLHFYLDSSGSMKDFLTAAKPGLHNYFEKVLNQAGNVLSESWDANVTFWRFGEGEPRPLDEEALHRFLTPAAFTDRSTHIEKAIEHNEHGAQEPKGNDRHQVKIILTDLWQNENRAGDLAQRLDEAYLNQEPMAVGVLGVRSAFHGKADLPKADPDSADSMPFYFLVSGRAPDVRFAIKHLVEDLKIADKDHFEIVFARAPASRLVHYLKVDSADKKSAISLYDKLVPGSRDKFPVITNVRHDLTLNMEEPAGEPRVTLGPYIKLSMHPKVTAVAYRKSEEMPDSKAQDQLTVATEVDPRQITVHRSLLDAGTMYRFRIDLVQDWEQPLIDLDAWNLENPQDMVNGRFPEDAGGQRPGRTLSLRHFLNVLRLKMRQHETPVARYYLYLQTN